MAKFEGYKVALANLDCIAGNVQPECAGVFSYTRRRVLEGYARTPMQRAGAAPLIGGRAQ